MWPPNRGRHPDMNVNDLDYSITYPIFQNFDIDRSWELLAAAIGYSTNQILTFELEIQRPHGSPTRTLLRDWGSRGATVRDFYDKLGLINKTQSMRLLEHIVHPDRDKDSVKDSSGAIEKADDKREDSSASAAMSMESKSDNFTTMPSYEPGSYNPESLPIPSMKKSNKTDNVNLNLPDGKTDKGCNKGLNMNKVIDVLGPVGGDSGAASNPAMEVTVHADGPASTKGNMGAASSAVPSFDRVRSVITDGSHSPYLRELSHNEREMAQALMSTPNYTYKEISQATDGFGEKNKLGQGKFGAVYWGMVKNTKCAIKKLVARKPGNSEDGMISELKALSRYRHENIINLCGYALDGDELCLVYQYMTHGSLYDCLHGKQTQHVLGWDERLMILQGAACGLQFLHTVDKKPVIHGDIKSANILLTSHYEAKIADFGLAQHATGGDVTGKMTHITKKTMGVQDYQNRAYYAPEISRGNSFSVKGDTYAFGVVMFECLTGQVAYDERREGSLENKYLVGYIESALDESPKMDKQMRFEDRRLKMAYPVTIFGMLFETAQRCVEEKKKDRPLMVDVYKDLQKCEVDESYINIQSVESIKRPTTLEKPSNMPLPHSSRPLSPPSMAQKSFTSEGSLSSVFRSPQYPPGMGSSQYPPGMGSLVPQSPIDMLPLDQPMPEAFKLALEQDKRKELVRLPPSYENVAQLTNQMKDCNVNENVSGVQKQLNNCKMEDGVESFASDPKKMAEIEKYEQNFSAPAPAGKAKAKMGEMASSKETYEALRHSVEMNDYQDIIEKVDESKYGADVGKIANCPDEGGKVTNENVVCPDYVNIQNIPNTGQSTLKEGQECSFDDMDECNCKPQAGENSEPDSSIEMEIVGAQCQPVCDEMNVVDFDKEFAEIADKATKGNSIFAWLDQEKQGIAYDSDIEDSMDDNMDFDIQFDFDAADESETSTITESINNDYDAFNSGDITEEDLFAQDNDSHYVNVPEKISNNVSANLEEHQNKLYRYQKMVSDDADELQERAAHLKGQGHGQSSDLYKGQSGDLHRNEQQGHNLCSKNNYSLPTFGSQSKEFSKSDNFDVSVKGHSLPAQGQAGYVNSQGHYVNHSALKFIRQHSPREASEGECSEYV